MEQQGSWLVFQQGGAESNVKMGIALAPVAAGVGADGLLFILGKEAGKGGGVVGALRTRALIRQQVLVLGIKGRLRQVILVPVQYLGRIEEFIIILLPVRAVSNKEFLLRIRRQ